MEDKVKIAGLVFDRRTVNWTIVASHIIGPPQGLRSLSTLASSIEVVVSPESLVIPSTPELRGNGFWLSFPEESQKYSARYMFSDQPELLPNPKSQTQPVETVHRIVVRSEEAGGWARLYVLSLRMLLPQIRSRLTNLKDDTENASGRFREILQATYPNLSAV